MADSVSIRRAKQVSVKGPAAERSFVRFWRGLKRAWDLSATSRANVAEAERLLRMSDRELEDVGLTRTEIYEYIFRNDTWTNDISTNDTWTKE